MKKLVLFIAMGLFAVGSLAQNSPPVANNDSVSAKPGETFTINAILNDYDPDGDAFRILHAGGVVSFTDSTITCFVEYEYELGEDGYLKFTYQLIDENNQTGNQSKAHVIVDVDDPFGDYLDINNIRARINSFGNHFYNPHHYEDTMRYEFPKGSGINSIFNSSFWIGGIAEDEQLRFAGERYRQLGSDFWTGPLSTDGTASIDATTAWNWRRVWKLERAQVIHHAANWNEPGYEAPEVILSWPAHGDTNLNQSYYLAPFVDVNNNGDYEPMSGDYPLVRGDQTLFFIFNDVKQHTESDGIPLGVEIHGMAWAYHMPEVPSMHNTIFLSYKIFNRSDVTLNDVYVSVFCDFDIGNPWDDYVGCDVERGFFYGYNGDDFDENGFGTMGYGEDIPAQGIVVLGGPYLDQDGEDNPTGNCDEGINGVGFGDGEIDNERYGMNSFMYFNNSGGIQGDPVDADHYYAFMNAIWKDGTAMEYGGNGHVNSGAYGPACKFMFPGLTDECNWGTGGIEPYGPKDWTEGSAGNDPNDRRGLSSMGPFTLGPEKVHKIDIAFVTALSEEGGGSSVDLLKTYVDTVKNYYYQDPDQFGFEWLSTEEISSGKQEMLNIFPNPCRTELMIQTTDFSKGSYQLFDMFGKKVMSGEVRKGQQLLKLDVSELPRGFYLVTVGDDLKMLTGKLVVK